MTKVFVSYCHAQGEWVWDRLVPVLKAGGAELNRRLERECLQLAFDDEGGRRPARVVVQVANQAVQRCTDVR